MEEDRTGPPDVPVDRRASDLGLQLEQVNVTLQQLRHTHGSLQDMETRLGEMTRECAGILDRWAKNDEKHAAAVVELHSRLSEWNDIERRLLDESATRVHQFERSLQHEWNGLRQKHEAPIHQLEAQSARIAETCLAAVDQALKGFDRAEARLATLERDLHREMADLAREVRGAIAEIRQGPTLGARQPWALDNVVRLHNELRAGDEEGTDAPATRVAATGTLGISPVAMRAPRLLETGSRSDLDQVDAAPVTSSPAATEPIARRRTGIAWIAAAAIALLAIAGYGVYLRTEIVNGLRSAAARADLAERDAAASRVQARQEIAAVRQVADERLATAQQAATAAQMVASIVASPDARRIELRRPGSESPAIAQLLWSRSQGVALTASRLPAPPPGRTYQLWLLTRTTPASVGLVTPNDSGPTSVAFPWPAGLQRMVVGAIVSIEPAEGSRQPSGAPWLVSPSAAPAPDAEPAPASPPGSGSGS